MATLLLVHGANANAQNTKQETLLHSAAWIGNLEVARILLRHSANDHSRDEGGQTALLVVEGSIIPRWPPYFSSTVPKQISRTRSR